MNRGLLEFFPALKDKSGNASDLMGAALSLYLSSLEGDERIEIIAGLSLALEQVDELLAEDDVVFINAIHPDRNYVIDTGYRNNFSLAEELISRKIQEMRGLLPDAVNAASWSEPSNGPLPYSDENISMDELGLSIEEEFDMGMPGVFAARAEATPLPEQNMFNIFSSDDDDELDNAEPSVEDAEAFAGGFSIGDDEPDVHVGPKVDMNFDLDPALQDFEDEYGDEEEEDIENSNMENIFGLEDETDTDLPDASDLELDENAATVVDKYIHIGDAEEEK